MNVIWASNQPEEKARSIERLREALDEADAVMLGAGAGLSTSAGFSYAGQRFQAHFQDFIAKYHFTDMYSAGFYHFPTLEEQWAYWSRHILVNRYQRPPKPVYERLLEVVGAKDCFVITTNVDHCFQRAGFEKQRLFYTQGDYGLWQCSEPCHPKTYDNEAAVRRMVETQRDMRIPSDQIPRCPVCGKPMSMNLRTDDTFVEDEGWHAAAGRYRQFLREHRHARVLFWELGTGMNTPGIIKYPFWQMTAQWPHATYACINWKEAFAPQEISERAICISADIGEVLEKLR